MCVKHLAKAPATQGVVLGPLVLGPQPWTTLSWELLREADSQAPPTDLNLHLNNISK